MRYPRQSLSSDARYLLLDWGMAQWSLRREVMWEQDLDLMSASNHR